MKHGHMAIETVHNLCDLVVTKPGGGKWKCTRIEVHMFNNDAFLYSRSIWHLIRDKPGS